MLHQRPNVRFTGLRPDFGLVSNILGGLAFGSKVALHFYFYSHNFNSLFGRFAINVVASAPNGVKRLFHNDTQFSLPWFILPARADPWRHAP